MGTVSDPVQIEQAIDACGDQIEDAVDIVDELLEVFLEADADKDRAFAQAFLDHQGPQSEKRYAAEVATVEQRKARDRAYLNYKYAERKANAVERRLSGLQTNSKSIGNAYNTYGRNR